MTTYLSLAPRASDAVSPFVFYGVSRPLLSCSWSLQQIGQATLLEPTESQSLCFIDYYKPLRKRT